MLFCVVSTLFAFFCAGYFLLDLQLIRGLRRLKKSNGLEPLQPSITVLIAARNEEHNLPRVLNALLAQSYPVEKTKVIVTNDRSEDGTEAVLKKYTAQHPDRIEYLNVSHVQPGMSPKMHALMRGLERAASEWIAVTDADSLMGPEWLTSMSREFETKTGMVLGLTAYIEPQGGSGFGFGAQTLEFASYGIVSAALVGLGFPVIANANNLAYRRKAFDEAEAFRKHGHIVSGDDDFLVQEIHATGNWDVRFCSAPGALMRTSPPDSWRHLWEQRKRWASKCMLYAPKQVAFLAVIFAFYASIPILLLAGFCDVRWFKLGLLVFAVKTVSDLLVMIAGLKQFQLTALLRYFPLTALLHIPLILGAVVAGTLRGFTWKGQRFSRQIKPA